MESSLLFKLKEKAISSLVYLTHKKRYSFRVFMLSHFHDHVNALMSTDEKREVMTMKIAVVCANGKEGKLIVKEAIDRGLDVTAVVRGENQSAASKVIKKDLFDLTVSDLEEFDAVIDAFGAWNPETLPQHGTSLKHLCDLVSGKNILLNDGKKCVLIWLL